MNKLLILIILLLTFNEVNAQTDEQIINEILLDLFGSQNDTIMIKSLKTKTYFEYDSISFEKTTGLTVPSSIIIEWKSNEDNKNFVDNWNEHYLNKTDTIFYDNDTIIRKKPIFKVMSNDEVSKLFERTQTRQKVYSISKILFDDIKENALFYFTITPWPGDFSSEAILIKKVFGKWTRISSFDFIMS